MIRLVVLMYVRFPLPLRNVENFLFERGIDICHEMVRLWWNRPICIVWRAVRVELKHTYVT